MAQPHPGSELQVNKTVKSSKTIRANKRKAKLKAKHRASGTSKQLTHPNSTLPTLTATHWHSGLVAIFVLLALAGCAERVISQGQSRYAPYSPENSGNMRDGGGVDRAAVAATCSPWGWRGCPLAMSGTRFDAVVFDLLTALLNSWALWNRIAESEERGREWRAAYLRRTYLAGRSRPYETLVAEAATEVGLSSEFAGPLAARYHEARTLARGRRNTRCSAA